MINIKYILLVVSFLLFGFFAAFAHGAETLSTTYWPGWNDYTSGVDGWELKRAGYPQFGQGQTVVVDIPEDKKDLGTSYTTYFPTSTEMRQMAQTKTGKPVTIYAVNRGTSYTFRAVSGSYTGKDGLVPSEALSNLLLRISNVPYYSGSGQILFFLR